MASFEHPRWVVRSAARLLCTNCGSPEESAVDAYGGVDIAGRRPSRDNATRFVPRRDLQLQAPEDSCQRVVRMGARKDDT